MGKRGRERLVPGAWFLLSIAAMVLLHRLLPGPRLIPLACRWVGPALIAAGLGFGLWAVGLFRTARTTLRPARAPTALVVRGPFRFSRHPMYLGLTAALCGVAVLLGSATPWAVVVAFFLFIARRFARAEERAMEESFGNAYRAYQRRVRPWL